MVRSEENETLSEGDAGATTDYENGRATTTVSRYSATGNEADIEDNVLPPCTPTQLMLSEMLRLKPPECAPTTPCRILSDREDFMKNSGLHPPPTTAERLTLRPKSAIETIIDTIERPKGAVPPLALPNWHGMPLDTKIPGGIRSPAGLLYYSPGKCCTQLHRKKKVFTLTDPYNRESIAVVDKPYTALHDPHAKDFIYRPETKRLLYKQGLINENNEVMFTLREFNKYRNYLRTIYSDEIHESVHIADELWKMEQEQLKNIRRYLSQSEGKEAARRKKLDRARHISKEMRDYKFSRYLYKQQQQEIRLLNWAKERERMLVENACRSSAKSRLLQEKRKAVEEEQKRIATQKFQCSVLKILRGMERKKEDAIMIKRVHENQLLEWMDAKINQSRERVDTYNRVQYSCRENLRINAAKRQRRVEAQRRNLPTAIEKKKEKEAFRWSLARKYFYVWLNKVRKHVSASAIDPNHESCWIRGVTGTLDETVKYLRFQTDTHERLDNFILDIIRLKDDIRRQLAEEEALETAAEEASKSQIAETKTKQSDYKEPLTPVPELEE